MLAVGSVEIEVRQVGGSLNAVAVLQAAEGTTVQFIAGWHSRGTMNPPCSTCPPMLNHAQLPSHLWLWVACVERRERWVPRHIWLQLSLVIPANQNGRHSGQQRLREARPTVPTQLLGGRHGCERPIAVGLVGVVQVGICSITEFEGSWGVVRRPEAHASAAADWQGQL